MPRIFLWALIAIVAIAPLPLGSNRPLGWSLLALAVGVLLLSWSVFYLWTKRDLPVPTKRVRGPLLLFSLACAWVLIQLVPGIPFGMAHPAWQEMNNFFGSEVPGRITIDPDWTLTILMRWITYAGVFWLALQLGRDRSAASLALKSFVWVSGAYALYGLIAHLSGSETVLFYDKWAYVGALTSTFVNRNSYATFAGLGLIVTVAVLLRKNQSSTSKLDSLRDRTLKFLSVSLLQNTYIYVVAFLLATALLLTGSRGGALSTIIALIIYLGLISRTLKIAVRSSAIVLVSGATIFAFSGGLLFNRLFSIKDDERSMVYMGAIEAIGDHGALGTGLGSFPQIFQLYRWGDVLGSRFWDKAHNTYLENALELGIPAVVVLNLAIAWLVLICWRGTQSRSRDHHFATLGIAVSALVGAHALVDFSLQIPAVTVAFMFLLGVAVAQSFNTGRL